MWQQETSIHRSFTAHMTPVFIVGESAHLEEGNLRRWRDLEGALMYQKAHVCKYDPSFSM